MRKYIMKQIVADRIDLIHPSAIRSVQKKIAAKDGVVSFAAGLPAADLFPVEEFRKATDKVFEVNGTKAMQYGMSQGYMPLIEKLVERMKKNNSIESDPSQVIISTGSQQGLFLSAMTLLNSGDTVVAENPSYLGAFNAFRGFGAQFCGVDVDDEGMELAQLEENLKNDKSIKLIYVIPNYQNPTGKSWSEKRRHDFMDLVSQYPVYVVEDDPYGDLCFDGNIQKPLKSMDKNNQVIYLGSFSKILSPGLRVAWVCSNTEIAQKMELLKQGIDLQSSEFTQHQVYNFLNEINIDDHIKKINKAYGSKCKLLLEKLSEIDIEGLKYTKPTGGMFVWLELPSYMNSSELIDDAINAGVAFIPGQYFFVDENITNTVRLNFTTVSEDDIIKGSKILKDFLKSVEAKHRCK
jgi:2-aminoadipate transaminase